MELKIGDRVLLLRTGEVGTVEYPTGVYARIYLGIGPFGNGKSWMYEHEKSLIVIPEHSTEQQVEALRRLYGQV